MELPSARGNRRVGAICQIPEQFQEFVKWHGSYPVETSGFYRHTDALYKLDRLRFIGPAIVHFVDHVPIGAMIRKTPRTTPARRTKASNWAIVTRGRGIVLSHKRDRLCGGDQNGGRFGQ